MHARVIQKETVVLPVMVTTEEFAELARTTSQSIVRQFNAKGNYLGVVPKKVGRQHIWPAAAIARALLDTGEKVAA